MRRSQPQARRRLTPPSPYRNRSGITLIEIFIVIVIIGILGAIVLAAIGYGSNDSSRANTDPKSGWVTVGRHLEKRCDGSTMLYHDTWDDAFHVAANAPECTG